MNGDAPYLLVRAAALYISALLTVVVWGWRRPTSRALAGAVLAFAWNLPVLLALHLVARSAGWWHCDARGGLLLTMPVDLYLAWAWLWGFVSSLAFPSARLRVVLAIALAADLVLMPAAAPVLSLGPGWLIGEAIGLVTGLLPAQLLARWTARDERLAGRAVLQVVAFSGLVLFVLPAIAIDASGTAWTNPLARPAWQLSLLAQMLAVPGLVGLTAVQEFAARGRGTPVPFDPPRRLVTTGVYAYVRNPMQLSAVVMLLLLGLVLENLWVAVAGVMAHIYSVGLAGWDEDEDLRRRFGESWVAYRGGVRRWRPRLRPWYSADAGAARLYVAETCGMCRDVGTWFSRRAPRGLVIVPAESHPSRELTRITYEPADGSRAASGVEAVARALEHTHLGWASLGFCLRLPIVCPMVQLLVDASGGEARPVPSRPLPG